MSLPTIWTARGQEWLYHQLESWQGGALIASHDRELLTRMPRIIELTPTALRSYGGNYDEYPTPAYGGAAGCARGMSMP